MPRFEILLGNSYRTWFIENPQTTSTWPGVHFAWRYCMGIELALAGCHAMMLVMNSTFCRWFNPIKRLKNFKGTEFLSMSRDVDKIYRCLWMSRDVVKVYRCLWMSRDVDKIYRCLWMSRDVDKNLGGVGRKPGRRRRRRRRR